MKGREQSDNVAVGPPVTRSTVTYSWNAVCVIVGRWLIRRKDIQHHGVGYTSSATRFALALSHDIGSCDLQVNIIPTVAQRKDFWVIVTLGLCPKECNSKRANSIGSDPPATTIPANFVQSRVNQKLLGCLSAFHRQPLLFRHQPVVHHLRRVPRKIVPRIHW